MYIRWFVRTTIFKPRYHMVVQDRKFFKKVNILYLTYSFLPARTNHNQCPLVIQNRKDTLFTIHSI